MRTKILGPNQRIKIGEGSAFMLGDDLPKFASVLSAVGLTLEIGKQTGRAGIIELFAARRLATTDIALGARKAKPAPAPESAVIPDLIPSTPAES